MFKILNSFLSTWILLPVVHGDVDRLQTHFLTLDEQVGQVSLPHVVAKHPCIPRRSGISKCFKPQAVFLGLVWAHEYMYVL